MDLQKKTNNKNNEEGRERHRNRDKIIILTTLGVVLLFAVSYFLIIHLINKNTNKNDNEVSENISFYPIDFNRDIESDTVYCGLDRQIYFEDPSYGITVAITGPDDGEISDLYKSTFKGVYYYIKSAISGDNKSLNDLFSEKYYKNGGTKKDEISPQMLYDITITIIDIDSINEAGEVWDRGVYEVKYKIRKNDGTFRNDMGSDCSKKQYFTVTYRNGKSEIDSIEYHR